MCDEKPFAKTTVNVSEAPKVTSMRVPPVPPKLPPRKVLGTSRDQSVLLQNHSQTEPLTTAKDIPFSSSRTRKEAVNTPSSTTTSTDMTENEPAQKRARMEQSTIVDEKPFSRSRVREEVDRDATWPVSAPDRTASEQAQTNSRTENAFETVEQKPFFHSTAVETPSCSITERKPFFHSEEEVSQERLLEAKAAYDLYQHRFEIMERIRQDAKPNYENGLKHCNYVSPVWKQIFETKQMQKNTSLLNLEGLSAKELRRAIEATKDASLSVLRNLNVWKFEILKERSSLKYNDMYRSHFRNIHLLIKDLTAAVTLLKGYRDIVHPCIKNLKETIQGRVNLQKQPNL